jgi:hypothetical protein
MDLRVYYKKIREVESGISTEDVIVVSHATADGGREGVKCEAARGIAARLIVDGRARLATAQEAAEFRKEMEEKRRQVEEEALARKVQLAVIPDADFKGLRLSQRTRKE